MILLYGNGLTEEIFPNEHTFSDQEILNLLKDCDSIQTKRLEDVPNTWCVWGELENYSEEDYNKLGSEIIEEHCYSKLLILHDTEVDPSWNLTDSIIYDGYDLFKKKILTFIDEIAIETIKEIEQIRDATGKTNLMSLDQVGISDDKRVIFRFSPEKQTPDFFDFANFDEFANKCFNFLDKFYKDGDILPIYADKKMIIIIEEESEVDQYIKVLINLFEKKEEYLKCARIKDIYKKWLDFKLKKKQPKKRGRPKKKKENDPES